MERRYLIPSTNDIFSFLTSVFDRIHVRLPSLLNLRFPRNALLSRWFTLIVWWRWRTFLCYPVTGVRLPCVRCCLPRRCGRTTRPPTRISATFTLSLTTRALMIWSPCLSPRLNGMCMGCVGVTHVDISTRPRTRSIISRCEPLVRRLTSVGGIMILCMSDLACPVQLR